MAETKNISSPRNKGEVYKTATGGLERRKNSPETPEKRKSKGKSTKK